MTDRYVECIQISTYGVRDFKVHLGIDVSMSRQDAQNILDHQGEEFSARLYGDDGWWSDDDDLGAVPVTWSAAGDGGLSAELDSVAPRGRLDEDRDEDEVYAIISLYVPSSGITRTFRSDTVHGDF